MSLFSYWTRNALKPQLQNAVVEHIIVYRYKSAAGVPKATSPRGIELCVLVEYIHGGMHSSFDVTHTLTPNNREQTCSRCLDIRQTLRDKTHLMRRVKR